CNDRTRTLPKPHFVAKQEAVPGERLLNGLLLPDEQISLGLPFGDRPLVNVEWRQRRHATHVQPRRERCMPDRIRYVQLQASQLYAGKLGELIDKLSLCWIYISGFAPRVLKPAAPRPRETREHLNLLVECRSYLSNRGSRKLIEGKRAVKKPNRRGWTRTSNNRVRPGASTNFRHSPR